MAINSTQPIDFCIGEVISTSPLLIKVSDNLVISEEFILLTRSVTNYIGTFTYIEGLINDDSAIKEGDTLTVRYNNGLIANDTVVLVKVNKGQKFIVIDRVGG